MSSLEPTVVIGFKAPAADAAPWAEVLLKGYKHIAKEFLYEKPADLAYLPNMIPKIVHQTARTKTLSGEEARLRRRAQRLLPNWQMKLWDDRDNLEMMERYFPEFSPAFGAINRGVVKADIARCAYMYAFGGLYMDTDYKLLRPISDELLGRECILPASRDANPDSRNFRLGNAIFASEPGHGFWRVFLTDIFLNTNLQDIGEGLVEKVTGPEGLTAFYQRHREFHSSVYIPERRFFHPRMAWMGLSYDRSFPAYGAHLCWGSWRSKELLPKVKTYAIRKLSSF